MDDGALADANKAEAATTTKARVSKPKLKSSNPKLGSSHVLVACLGKTAFLEFRSHEVKKWETRNSSQCLRTHSLACPPWTVLRNRSDMDNSAVNATSKKLHCHISWHCLIRIGFFLVGIKD
jgi:hypothetical protein